MNDLRLHVLILTSLNSLLSVSHTQTITLDEFLDQLVERHPLFEKERLAAQIERAEKNAFLGAQDWNAVSSVNLFHEEPVIAFAGPEKTDALSLAGGIRRAFWKTGGRLSASFSSSRADIEISPLYGFPSSFYQNEVAITYVHPLVRNRKGFLDRLEYDLEQFDIDFSEARAMENQEDFLAGAAEKFLDWVLLSQQKKILEDRLELSQEELARTKKKREANLVDQVDVIRAQDAVRIAEQNQVLVESQWQALQAELAVLSQNKDLHHVSPEFELYELKQLRSLEEAISDLKKNSRLINAINVRRSQLQHIRRGFEETLKPNLALVAQLNSKNIDEGFGNSLQMDKPDALLELQFSLPLGNRTAKSRVMKTDLEIRRLDGQLEEFTLALTSTLVNLNVQILEFEKVLALNQEQIASARERTGEELKLYEQGRGDLTFVIQSQDSEQNAKLTYARNAITYHKLFLQYRALMDELFT